MSNCIGLFKKMAGKKLKLTEKLQEFEQQSAECDSALLISVRLDHFTGVTGMEYVTIENIYDYVLKVNSIISVHE